MDADRNPKYLAQIARGSASGSDTRSDLPRDPANYAPLTPIGFLDRAAKVYPDHVSVIHGQQRYSWRQTAKRCHQLAGALHGLGVRRGDVVAIIAPNVPALYEAHFGVPMAGAVLLTLNTRLDVDTTAYILEHSATRVLLCDREFAPLIRNVLQELGHEILVIDIDDPLLEGSDPGIGFIEYEKFLQQADPDFVAIEPLDEWDSISLNYTSGTTGRPKGALYSYRATYLNAMGNMVSSGLQMNSVYLWTLPMFHCNGWCFPWTLALMAGTSVCLRKVEPAAIFRAIEQHRVQYFCGAPIVLNLMANAPLQDRYVPDWPVKAMTGGAAPPAALIAAMADLGIEVDHLYGLTETLGPSILCSWHEEWDGLPLQQQAELKSRIGVRKHTLEQTLVVDPQTMLPVPHDGKTIGELVMRGNTVMKGYLNDLPATQQAFRGGWFHSGDLVVVHPDGYYQVKDRLKDIVISGGENISTVEVEGILYRHPAVLEAAVVAMPHQKWGETPCAFVTCKPGREVTQQELLRFCREHLAGFKVPQSVIFADLPKTSTGKVQKFVLRQMALEYAQSGGYTAGAQRR